MNYDENAMNGFLDFDGEFTADTTERAFQVLPEGDYDFEVEKVDRAYVKTDGGSKYAGAPMAQVTFIIRGRDESGEPAEVHRMENFILHTNFVWKLSQLFVSVGLAKNGETLKMNWAALPTRTGKCHVKVRTYKKKDGSDGRSNEIAKFYDPADMPASAAAPAWAKGF